MLHVQCSNGSWSCAALLLAVHGPQEHFLSQETDTLRIRIKPSSLEDTPSMAGTFTEPGAKLESGAVALVRKEVMD